MQPRHGEASMNTADLLREQCRHGVNRRTECDRCEMADRIATLELDLADQIARHVDEAVKMRARVEREQEFMTLGAVLEMLKKAPRGDEVTELVSWARSRRAWCEQQLKLPAARYDAEAKR